MNSKGQIMIELLFYLIIILLILSVVIYLMATLDDNQVTRINSRELNNILEDSIATLTETTGKPSNWDKDINNVVTVGLRSNDNSLISYNKLMQLKSNYRLMNSYFPSGVDYSLTLYPKNSPNDRVLISGSEYLDNRKQIRSKSVEVVFDYDYTIIPFNNRSDTDICPLNHNDTWACKALTIGDTSLSNGEYYIVTDTSASYQLTNTYSQNVSGKSSGVTNINDDLERLVTADNQTIYLHICTKDNTTSLVYDTNNRQEFLNSVIKPEIYILNMKVAI